jgi:hypothetical protein
LDVLRIANFFELFSPPRICTQPPPKDRQGKNLNAKKESRL